MNRQLRILGLGLLANSFLLVALWHGATAAETVFPAGSWQQRAPQTLRLDPRRIDKVATALGGRGCIVKNGYMVKTWGDQSARRDWFSAAKPVLSTLLFFAIQEGRVASVDMPIAAWGWQLKPKDRPMTFRHLGSMTSGYARPEPPGAAWAYNDFAIQLYQKTLFDRVFAGNPAEVANSADRFGALGLEDGLAFQDTTRRMNASVRDYARIGWFWLNRGRWHDRQLLPKRYFDLYMKPQTSKDLPPTRPAPTDDYLKIGSYGGGSDHFTKYGAGIYGFNWWFNATGRLHPTRRTWPDAPPDTVMAIGVGGNCAALMPGLNLLVVAADAHWGPLQAGRATAVMNGRLKRIAAAGTPLSVRPASAASGD